MKSPLFRELRFLMFGIVLLASSAVLPPALGGHSVAIAQSQQRVATHTVEANQTLYSISRLYGVTVDQLKEWNELRSNNIRVGQVLLVKAPVKANAPTSAPASSPASRSAQASSQASASTTPARSTSSTDQERPQTRRHVVSAGETLYSISRRYGLTVSAIQELNGLNGTVLSIGQELLVEASTGSVRQSGTAPDSRSSTATGNTQSTNATGESPGTTALAQAQGPITPTAQGANGAAQSATGVAPSAATAATGETTGRADLEVPESPEDLALTAAIRDQLRAEPGSSTRTYVVKSGDTLNDIAKVSGMSVIEIRKLNGLSGEILNVGQILYLSAAPSTPSLIRDASASSIPQGAFIEYEVEANETIGSIASRFAMTREELVALNPDIESLRSLDGISITVLLPSDRTFKNPYLRESLQKGYEQIAVRSYPVNAYAMATTSGELYNPKSFTGAHASLPLGSIVYIENSLNGMGAFVRINDRQKGEGLMVSSSVFSFLGFEGDRSNMAVITTSM